MRALQVESAMQWAASPSPQVLSTAESRYAGLRQILCVSDVHASEDLALQRASALGRQFHAHVHVLYIDSQRISDPVLHLIRKPEGFVPTPQVEMFLEKSRVGPTDVRTVAGRFSAAIAQIDDQFGIDLIVTARDTPQSERLIRKSRTPVLIAQRTVDDAYRQIVVATDLTKRSLRLLTAMNAFGWLDVASISLVHAFGLPYRGLQKTPRVIPEHLEAYRTSWQKLVLKQMRSDLELTPLDAPRVRLQADLAVPIDLIRRELADTSCDLLVAGRSRWMRLQERLGRSVTHALLQSVDCDMLVVP